MDSETKKYISSVIKKETPKVEEVKQEVKEEAKEEVKEEKKESEFIDTNLYEIYKVIKKINKEDKLKERQKARVFFLI